MLSTPTRLPLVEPLLLAAPPVVICLCTVLRYLDRVQVMTPVEVVWDWSDLTCKRGSVGQSEGLLIPRSLVRFRLKPP